MLSAKALHSLTFYINFVLHEEVNEVSVLNTLAMELNREVMFTINWLNATLFKDNLHCVLIHILIEPRTHIRMHRLTTTIQIIAIFPQLLTKHRVMVCEFFYIVVHDSLTKS